MECTILEGRQPVAVIPVGLCGVHGPYVPLFPLPLFPPCPGRPLFGIILAPIVSAALLLVVAPVRPTSRHRDLHDNRLAVVVLRTIIVLNGRHHLVHLVHLLGREDGDAALHDHRVLVRVRAPDELLPHLLGHLVEPPEDQRPHSAEALLVVVVRDEPLCHPPTPP